VEDIQRAREFYEEILKQKVTLDFGENIVFEGCFAIHLKAHFSKLIDNKKITKGSNNFELITLALHGIFYTFTQGRSR
jgi:hypothetical protein